MKHRKRLMTCLVAGVLILAVSAAAAFGSVNGYAKYKSAVMALAMEEDNFSAAADMTMTLDGKPVLDLTLDAALAAPDYGYTTTYTQNGKTYEEFNGTIDGQHIWYYDEDTYHTYDDAGGWTNLLGFDAEDEMQNRLVAFMEIAADTVVGDLKNNFVEIGAEEGSTLYQVTISNAQVPALVNAGLSLFAYAVAGDQTDVSYVTYEDPNEVMYAYYESVTGKTLSQEFKDEYKNWSDEWYQANQEAINAFEQVVYGEDSYWGQAYDDVLDAKGGGVVYVRADGSYEYYEDGVAYAQAVPNSDPLDDIYYYMGQDMVLDSIDCVFGVDGDDRLTSNQITVTFTTTGLDGQHHELVMAADLAVFDYDATTVPLPDLGDRVES